MTPEVKEFWSLFLSKTSREQDQLPLEVFAFCDNEQDATALLALVLSGEKTATASSLLFYPKEDDRPRVGDLSVVTDWHGAPACVIETTALLTLPFQEFTFEIVKREGEDDTLESWQKNHIAYYTREGLAAGYEFSWDMPVLFEDFKVVYTG